MKIWICAILIFVCGISRAQFDLNIPVDSAGHIALINAEGTKLTEWKRLQEVQTDLTANYHLGKWRSKWGILNQDLEFVVDPEFSKIYTSGNYILAESPSYLAVYNQKLRLIKEFPQFREIEFTYGDEYGDWMMSQLNDRMVVKTADGCYLFNEDFSEITKESFDDAFIMDGLIYLRNDNLFGFVSEDNEVFVPEWTSVSTYNDQVMELTESNDHRIYIARNGFRLPDTDSTLIFHPDFKLYKVYKDGKGRLVDINREEFDVNYSGSDIFPISYQYQGSWRGEVRQKKLICAVKQGNQIAVINESGRELISAHYDFVGYAGPGALTFIRDFKYGVMDMSGQIIYDTIYSHIQHSSGYLRLYQGDRKGIGTVDGRIIVPVTFDQVEITGEGIITESEGKYGFYTFEGVQVLAPNYDRIVDDHGGLEFVQGNGRCMVGTKGLLTPLACDKVSRIADEIKYYKGNQIVVCEIENDLIVDTTVYPRIKSVVISKDKNDDYHSLTDHKYAQINWQLNGKIGCIAKNGDGFGVYPKYNNLIDEGGPGMVKTETIDFMKFDYAIFNSKEHIHEFYPASSYEGKELFSYLPPLTRTAWHSSNYDPIILTNKQYDHRSGIPYSAESNFLLPKKGRTMKALIEGAASLSQGEEVIGIREYYTSLNAHHNLKIESKSMFSLLSIDSPIKVEEPVWQVTTFARNRKIGLNRKFVKYKDINGIHAIASSDGSAYGVVVDGKEWLIEEECDEIIPVSIGFSSYFKVRLSEDTGNGLSRSGWTIYDGENRIFDDVYDDVEVLGLNFFKLTKDGIYLIVDEMGNEIYSSDVGFTASTK